MNLPKWAVSKLLLLTLMMPLAFKAQAESNQCSDLFPKIYKTQDFVLSIEGKKQSKRFLEQAHENLVADDDPAQLIIILTKISDYGTASLSSDQRDFIFKFRQNSSLLRSIFQTSEKSHSSPTKFGRFVKDFGVLKDFLMMEDFENVQLMAIDILKKYGDLDFAKLLKKAKPASKKSVAIYFEGILQHAKLIMEKETVTIDEVHDVRKNLRDVLRFIQVERDLSLQAGRSLSPEKEDAIYFLKKLNTKLGFICDEYAAQILVDKENLSANRITKKTLVQFPLELRPKVEHFLNLYKIEIIE